MITQKHLAMLCLLFSSVANIFAQQNISTIPSWRIEGVDYSDRLGARTEEAGDVNGDGYEDVLVNALGDATISGYEGITFLYYGSATGPSTTPDWYFEGDQNNAYLGESISGGDLNGDGYSDILIGSSRYNTFAIDDGIVYAFFGGPDGPSELPDWYATSGIANSNFGFNCNATGDLNNDGYNDVVIGQDVQKKVLVYYGSAAGPSWTPSATIVSPNADITTFGYFFTVANTNGDDYDDVVVCGRDNIGFSDKPVLYVFYGSSTGVSLVPDWSYFNIAGISIVDNAGDVNNDGYEDLICYQLQPILFTGGPTGLSLEPVWSYATSSPTISHSIGGAGDVNNDGYDDVLVYCYYFTDFLEDTYSTVLLFAGYEGGLSDFPIWWDHNINDTYGNYQENIASVSGAGDLNGDGYDDFITGFPEFLNETSSDVGAVNLYFGGTNPYDPLYDEDLRLHGLKEFEYYGSDVASLGDINDDGFDDLAIGCSGYDGAILEAGKVDIHLGSAVGLSPTPSVTYEATATTLRSGMRVCGPGDITGDGYEDMLVSCAHYTGVPATNVGKILLFKGSASGIDNIPDGSYIGTYSNGQFGYYIAGLGDVNGDGINDFATGEPGYDNGQTDEGRIFVFYGASPAPSATPSWTFENDIAFAKLAKVAGKGDINNDGYNDMICSAPAFVGGMEGGRAYVFYGSATGLATTPGWVKSDMASADYYGQSISIAGNLNGDQFDDVVVSTSEFDDVLNEVGRVDIFYGKASGITVDASVSIIGDTIEKGISGGTPIGDFNGDGYDDIIYGTRSLFDFIEAYSFPVNMRFYITNGSSAGISDKYSYITNPFDHFGGSGGAYSAGDINGDGFGDFYINAPGGDLRFGKGDVTYSTEGFQSVGMVCIYYGSASSCSPITSLSLVAATTSSLTLTCASDPFIEHYDLRYKKTGVATWTYISSATNSITLTGLLSCTSYEMQMQSFCNSGGAAWSPLQTFTTTGCATCGVPTGLTATQLSSVKVKLSWGAVAGATQYKISYRVLPSGSWINTNATATSKTISGLTPGSSYEWKIKTVCGALSSAFSPIQNFTMLMREENVKTKPEIDIFPNPSSGQFTVAVTNCSDEINMMTLYALDGKSVEKRILKPGLYETYESFDLNLSKGIYFICTTAGETILTQKIIIE